MTLMSSFAAWLTLIADAPRAAAQVFNGPRDGLQEGLEAAQGQVGIAPGGSPRDRIVDIIGAILDYVGLAAVVVIIVAGIMLIVGMGSEESRDRAKRIVLYTAIGLLLILFSRVIVMTVQGTFQDIF